MTDATELLARENDAEMARLTGIIFDLIKALEPFANGIVTPDGTIIGLMREDVARARGALAAVSSPGKSND